MRNLAVGAAAGLAMGVVIARWLRPLRYRLDLEAYLPHPRRRWLIPTSVLASSLVTGGLAARWPVPVVLTGLALTWVLIALSAIDLDVHRLPDAITLPTFGIALFALAGCSVAVGDPWPVARGLLACLIVAPLFLGVSLIGGSDSGLGLGDVKLAAVLALVLGWFGWTAVVLGLYAAFFVGGLWAAGLLATRRADRSTHLAFGPFLSIGAVLAMSLS